ncbi:MAG: S41 family peptidase [Candidatus Eremiobacteraeota bacterium]|nr:S41 family peptidase [Candidatus Eremiobacteraeota bacterium]
MKRFASLAFILVLALTTARVPAATAPQHSFGLLDAEEISIAYQRLLGEFYKKVSTEAVLSGAHDNLVAYLKKNGVSNAKVPAVRVSDDPATNIRELDREVEAVSAEYPSSKFTPRDLTYATIAGMLGSVKDRYTTFLSPRDYAALNEGLDGTTFSGTGIVIESNDTTKMITISSVVPDGPADRAGLQQDDVISTIDGKSTYGLTIQQASKLLRGTEGTRVTLQIQRDGHNISPVTIVRAPIRQLSVYSRMLPNKIGYVGLTVFGRDTGKELSTALDRLQAQGARAFVLDLRDNGGGYLSAAIDVSSKFIPSGPIVSVESRQSQIDTLEAENTAIPPMPLAVLVNGHTASASEITSGAIQDSGVGTLIGTKTFGKGVVQTIYPLPDGSAVKITTARYLTPRNRDINSVGIQPDITAEENKSPRFGDLAKDTQLQTAVAFLVNKIARQGGSASPAPQ